MSGKIRAGHPMYGLLPTEIEGFDSLAELALDMRWSWSHYGDELWEKLSEGGEKGRCGWLKDKFGLWWQIIPSALGEMLGATDRAAAQRAFSAMLGMKKLDIAALRRAFEGA